MQVRRASAADTAAMSTVLIASITQLCGLDHHNDPAAIAGWTANKTPAGVRAMLERAALTLLVVEHEGAVAAVGAIEGDMIVLNYVAPARRFMGVSKLLLAAMERELAVRGIRTGRLVSTTTACRFYQSAGWTQTAPGAPGTGYPMCKDF